MCTDPARRSELARRATGWLAAGLLTDPACRSELARRATGWLAAGLLTDPARGSELALRAMGWLAAGLLLAGAAPARALSTDSGQPISIQADRAEHDDANRTTIYGGDVVIDQGSLRILGDTVTIRFDGRGEVVKMTAVGAPAHFRQRPDGDAGHRKAWARRMVYFPEQELMVLFEEARYEKGDGSQVQADRLAYDSHNARFKALTDTADGGDRATGGKPGRVRIEIRPKQAVTE